MSTTQDGRPAADGPRMRVFRQWGVVATAIAVVGILISGALAVAVHRTARAQFERDLDLEGQRVVADLETTIRTQLEAVESTAGYLGLSWPTDREGFVRVLEIGPFSPDGAVEFVSLVELVPVDAVESWLERESATGGPERIVVEGELPADPPYRALVSRAVDVPAGFEDGIVEAIDVSSLFATPIASSVIARDELTLVGLGNLPDLEVPGLGSADRGFSAGEAAFAFVVPVVDPGGSQVAALTANTRFGPLVESLGASLPDEIAFAVEVDGAIAASELVTFNTDRVGTVEDAARSTTEELDSGSLTFVFTAWSSATADTGPALAVLVVGTVVSLLAALVLSVRRSAAERERVVLRQLDHSVRRAETDPLTGLLNRAGLVRSLHRMWDDDDPMPLAVMFCDLDRFKRVNDTLGHEAGDVLLGEIAARLRAVVREVDHVGRFGGDEFVVVARVPDVEAARHFADRVVEAATFTTVLEGIDVDVRCSVGLTVHRHGDGRRPEDLLREADAAMYRAKADRRGGVVEFGGGPDGEVVEQGSLERRLASALPEGQLAVHYQPLVRLDGTTSGLEALVRWHHPERGLLTPGAFLVVARELGLWAEISEWVMDRALADLADDGGSGISVNLAGEQLDDHDSADRLRALLARHDVDPRRVVLEIGEDVVMEDDGRRLSRLRSLQDTGAQVALDDFGAGRTSLDLLRRFAFVDVVKLDRTLLVDLVDDPISQAVVHGVVATARALGCRIVGEGVETPEQLEACRELGLDLVQGYLVGHPGPLDEIRRTRTP